MHWMKEVGAAYTFFEKRGSVCPDIIFLYVEVVQEDLLYGLET